MEEVLNQSLLTEGLTVGERLSSTGGGSVTINYKTPGSSPNEF